MEIEITSCTRCRLCKFYGRDAVEHTFHDAVIQRLAPPCGAALWYVVIANPLLRGISCKCRRRKGCDALVAQMYDSVDDVITAVMVV